MRTRKLRLGSAVAGLVLTASVVAVTAVGGVDDQPAATPGPYSLSARQARGVSVTVELLDAFNRRDLTRALAQFADDPRFVRFVGGNDCDYRRAKAVRFVGRRGVAEWLRQRFADRDRLTVSTVRLLGDRGAAVAYTRRTSTSLADLGFQSGIQPNGTKVGFTMAGPPRITQFASAGDDEGCRPSTGPGAPGAPPPLALTARQAQEISVAARFIDAFNGRRLATALALLGADVAVSDCDYGSVRAVQYLGRHEVERWLRRRFADRDRLALARVLNENPDQPAGVLSLEYGRRRSETLRRLGFPEGIAPRLATKVVFSSVPVRIVRFVNGPVGGSRALCRPTLP